MFFNPRYVAPNQRSIFRDRWDGFQGTVLGTPSTYWRAADQYDPNFTIRQRGGFGWVPNTQDGGTIVRSDSTWFNLPTVNLVGGGANVRLGLRCDDMAGYTNARTMFYTIAMPVYYPAGFAPLFIEASFNGGADNNRYLPTFWNAITPGCGVQINGVNHILAAWAPANVLNPTILRRAIFTATCRPNAGNGELAVRVHFNGGVYAPTVKTITSGAVGSYTRFGLGYACYLAAVNALSSDLSYGGAVCWKDLGSDDATLDQIADHWKTFYPLI